MFTKPSRGGCISFRLVDQRLTVFALLFSGFLSAFVGSLEAQPYGLSQRAVVGPFLNNVLPSAEQNVSWQFVNAFPGLVFSNAVSLVPEPRASRLWVIEHRGRIYSFTNSLEVTNKTLRLDLAAVTQFGSEGGMLGMAFHPEFGLPGSTNRGYFYVWYCYSPSPVASPTASTRLYNRLSRFTVPDGSLVVNQNSEMVMINQLDENYWHNGGGMFFGSDGFLYLTVGDEGRANDSFANTQKINGGLFSGMLRIDVDQNPTRSHPIRRQPQNGGTVPNGWPQSYSTNYYIPNDNPWLDAGGTVLEEFYAIGLRGPHRASYDAPSGRIWMGDVGQDAWEEVNVIEKGGNYQWAYREGTNAGPKLKPASLIGVDKPPVHTYPHSGGGGAVIGGFVYRGTRHAAQLDGKYIFGDYVFGRVYVMDYNGVLATTVNQLANVPSIPPSSALSSFGLDHSNEVYICMIGNVGIYRLEQVTSQSNPAPSLLSQAGVFTNLTTLSTAAALIPYTVNSPLWSDGAEKWRWMSVPNNGAPYSSSEQITFTPTGNWSFPIGTVLVKHFELPLNETNSSVRKRLETRLLTLGTNGLWFGYTYKWRADNSNADLLPGSLEEAIPITTSTGIRTQIWYYPSRQDCQTCHNVNSGQVLGLRTCQMNGDLTYLLSGITDNQLRALNHVGMFNPSLSETNLSAYPRAVSLTNTSASAELRVRSYLEANCAHCHQPNGVRANFDARFDTPLNSQNIINGPVENSLGVTNARLVAPLSLSQSILYLRDNASGSLQMPPLARQLVDTNYINTLAEWINSLPSSEGLPSPWGHQDVGPVGVAGDATYTSGVFTVNASGVDIYDTADSFHFVYRPLQGDCVITALVNSLSATDEWALAGVMVRQNLTAGSPHAFVGRTSEHGISFTRRVTAGATSPYSAGSQVAGVNWVRLVRNGNTLTAFESADGLNWTQVGAQTINMSGTVYAGLAYSSHANTVLGAATFSNVLLTGANLNNPPTISAIAAQTINEDSSTGPLVFTIGDVETPAGNLTLSATSSVPSLIPVANLVLGGSASNRTITVTPTANASGTGSITVIVSDNTNSTANSFQLMVLPVNDAPIASPDLLTRWISQGVVAPIASFLTNDTDVDGDALSLLSLGVSSPGSSLAISNNLVRYWPAFGSTNADQFSYLVSDGHGGTATGLVSVAVLPDPAGMDLLSIAHQPGPNFHVQLSGLPGFTYTIQSSDILTPPNWYNIGVWTADGEGRVEITDSAAGNATRFYRAVRGLAH